MLNLTGPVVVAAGCGGTGRELLPYDGLSGLGAFTTASVTTAPRPGGSGPRIAETACGLLTSLGLPGPGIDAFLDRDLPWLTGHDVTVIVSICGNSLAEYGELARRVATADGIAAIEVNLSSPDGSAAARDGYAAQRVLTAVTEQTRSRLPVLAKLSADSSSVVEAAAAAVRGGADGVTLVNALPGLAMDPRTLRAAVNPAAGLSGPALHAIAVRAVYDVHAALPELPIVGTGGVRTGWDALELVLAGASAVGVGSALLREPAAAVRIAGELDGLLAGHGLELADAVGLAHRAPGTELPDRASGALMRTDRE